MIEIDTAAALQMVEDGMTNKEIAAHFKCAANTVVNRLEAFDPSAYARARSISAEAWLDRGLEPLRDALDKGSNIDATAARAYAQECARRAALRNPAYREKTAHEHTGADGKPIEYVRIERNIVKSE